MIEIKWLWISLLSVIDFLDACFDDSSMSAHCHFPSIIKHPLNRKQNLIEIQVNMI